MRSGYSGGSVETTGYGDRRANEERAEHLDVRPDETEIVSLEAAGEAGAAPDGAEADAPCDCEADGVEIIGDASHQAEEPDAEAAPEGEPAEDGDPGRPGKLSGFGQFKVDPEWLRKMWSASTIGRVAVAGIAVYSLVIAGAYFFLLQPASKQLHEFREQKNVLHDYVVIQQAGAAIGSFKDGLMTGDQRLTVMSEVKMMAEGSGVRIVGDPELLLKREVSGRFAQYPVKLKVRGRYHEIGQFLSLLESSPRFIVVEEVEIMSEAASLATESEATVLLGIAAWEE